MSCCEAVELLAFYFGHVVGLGVFFSVGVRTGEERYLSHQ